MTGETQRTTDHDTIRQWAQKHNAQPAMPRGTQDEEGGGVLVFDVEGFGADEEELEHVDWDRWFEVFEDRQLAMLYQEETAAGEPSNFFRIVDRNA